MQLLGLKRVSTENRGIPDGHVDFKPANITPRDIRPVYALLTLHSCGKNKLGFADKYYHFLRGRLLG
jgi:hypothetical protein